MATQRFAVVGPKDLVPAAAAIVEDYPGIAVSQLPYEHESQTVDLVERHADEVDAWLFTGIVPFQLAETAGVLRQPAAHVSYGSIGFLSSLVRLARDGASLDSLSIDTIDEEEVRGALAGTGIDLAKVRVLPYRPGTTSEQLVKFHRAQRRKDPETLALTCLASAYEDLHEEQPTVRLVPAELDVRAAVESLTWQTATKRNRDGTAVIGLISLARDVDLSADLAPLCGELVHTGEGQYLILTTLGPFEQVTNSLTAAPFLSRLVEAEESAQMGFGLARSAAEAATRAAHALSRAQAIGSHAVVVSPSEDTDLILEVGEAADHGPSDYSAIAARTGIRRETLIQIRDLAEKHDGVLLASQVAESFGILERSARRILKRLERGGAAVGEAVREDGQTGRPPVGYSIRL